MERTVIAGKNKEWVECHIGMIPRNDKRTLFDGFYTLYLNLLEVNREKEGDTALSEGKKHVSSPKLMTVKNRRRNVISISCSPPSV
jgi:hypothetical protein